MTIKITRTAGLGFNLEDDGCCIFTLNLRKWSIFVKSGNTGFCASILDRIFWRGTLKDGLFQFKTETTKNGNRNIDFRILIIQGAVQLERKDKP